MGRGARATVRINDDRSSQRVVMSSALIIYENALFAELITEALAKSQVPLDIRTAKPDKAGRLIAVLQPELILLDETIQPTDKETLLHAAWQLPSTEVVLLHPQYNTFVHITVCHSALTRLEDVGKVLNMAASKPSVPRVQSSEQARRDHALTQASVYGFLAAVFNQQPDIEFVQHLRDLTGDSIRVSGAAEGLNPEITQGIEQIAVFIDEAALKPIQQVQEALALDWTRLFRGLQRGGGPQPPYANLYLHGREGETESLHTIVQTYVRHNAHPASSEPNRPDYLGVMLDFMRFLFEREAEAWSSSQPEKAEAHFDAANQFREEHLGRWAQQFCEDALNYAETDFYRGGLHITKGFMTGGLE